MQALPAEAAALEADAIVTAIALEHTHSLCALAAEVAVVKLESALH